MQGRKAERLLADNQKKPPKCLEEIEKFEERRMRVASSEVCASLDILADLSIDSVDGKDPDVTEKSPRFAVWLHRERADTKQSSLSTSPESCRSLPGWWHGRIYPKRQKPRAPRESLLPAPVPEYEVKTEATTSRTRKSPLRIDKKKSVPSGIPRPPLRSTLPIQLFPRASFLPNRCSGHSGLQQLS